MAVPVHAAYALNAGHALIGDRCPFGVIAVTIIFTHMAEVHNGTFG